MSPPSVPDHGMPPLDGFDDIMDDLISMDGHGGVLRNTAETSDESNPPLQSPDSPDEWRLSNAVHMELQENAKLPTLYWTVDRTGSVVRNKPKNEQHRYSDPQQANDSIPEQLYQPSLMESFLRSDSRAGRVANYAHAGILKQDTTKRLDDKVIPFFSGDPDPLVDEAKVKLLDMNSADPLDELAAMDPTPLSEMKQTNHSELVTTLSTNSAVAVAAAVAQHHTIQQYTPRQYPLPIPTSPALSTPAGQHAASQATPFTNDISSSILMPVANTVNGIDLPQSVLPTPQSKVSVPNEGPCRNKSVPTSTPSIKNATKPAPKHSEAHSVLRPALQNASKERSQYGFGRKHVVPSVPPAPRSASDTSKAVLKPATASSIRTGSRANDRTSDCDSPGASQLSGTAAYERKKQRAKNARIKLNESIDRLSHAISLAGTQSKERAKQWTASSSSSNIGGSDSVVRILQQCVDTSDNAKKWDRPSFVGSAASLILGLNAQCEALYREVQSLQQERANAVALAPLQNQHQVHTTSLSAENEFDASSATKRRRLNGFHGTDTSPVQQQETNLIDSLQFSSSSETTADVLVFSERKIMDHVASFLEPLSIVRCMTVSKAWREWGVFSNEPLWQNLAVNRFGFFNVRQWKTKLEDQETFSTAPATFLYKKMDNYNVMPQLRRTDGLFLLGESRLGGKLSAWTFLVERSNGETIRSVLRQPGSGGDGMYASIPVVQLWTVIQNTGVHDNPIVIRDQIQTVDSSTRRRGEQMAEIDWDERFQKRMLYLDGSRYNPAGPENLGNPTSELCRLRLFDTVIMESNIYAKGCTTTSKFVQRSNFTKILAQIHDGVTVPLVVTFPRDRT